MIERAPAGPDRGDETDALPPFPFRHRIIPALHDVVLARFAGAGPGLSPFYAAVAALSLNEALGLKEDSYSLQAGHVHVRVRGSEELVMRTTPEDAAGRSFHAWAERRHPSGRVEVVDLSTRHFGDGAAISGLHLGARFPRAVWGWADDLPRAFRYVPDEEASATFRDAFRSAHENAVAEAAREVLVRIRGEEG